MQAASCILLAIPLLAGSPDPALLETRAAAWRAWFGNDRDALVRLLADDMVALTAGDTAWHDRDGVLRAAVEFATAGARLTALQFPGTRVQELGDVAVLHTLYRIELEHAGSRWEVRGRATEIFVRSEGRWRLTGWHLEPRSPPGSAGRRSPPIDLFEILDMSIIDVYIADHERAVHPRPLAPAGAPPDPALPVARSGGRDLHPAHRR